MIEIGEIYEHYKGGRYMIVARAVMESTKEVVVVYRSLRPDEHHRVQTWVRPETDFNGYVEIPHGSSAGTMAVRRFKVIGYPD